MPAAQHPSHAATVTVVIACWSEERWPQLSDAVASVLAQTVAPGRVVVVVDHNEALRRRVAEQWPSVVVVANRFSPGASGARNTGASTADGDIVAFLDDDAAATPTWLERLLQPFTDPAVVGAGGGVDPAWEAGRPPWFPDEFLWLVGATGPQEPGRPERAPHPVRNVWAENMAVRRGPFDAVGGFREGFGKVGSHSSPEDTDLCIRLAAFGTWVMVPDARVRHHVPAQRGSVGFFLRRSFHEGEGKAVLRALSPPGVLGVEADFARTVVPAAVVRGLRQACRERRGAPAVRSLAVATGAAAAAVGYGYGALASRRSRRSRPAGVV
jgi:GT2 family glycosyltransferase